MRTAIWLAILAATAGVIYAAPSPITVAIAVSVIGFVLSMELIPGTTQLFIDAGLYGIDLNKESKEKVYVSVNLATCIF